LNNLLLLLLLLLLQLQTMTEGAIANAARR